MKCNNYSLLLLLLQGTPKNTKQLDAARETVGFARSVDGRVILKSNSGTNFQVKLDMGTPGVMLLRYVQSAWQTGERRGSEAESLTCSGSPCRVEVGY